MATLTECIKRFWRVGQGVRSPVDAELYQLQDRILHWATKCTVMESRVLTLEAAAEMAEASIAELLQVINFAIELGIEADTFLRTWSEGDYDTLKREFNYIPYTCKEVRS